MDYRQYKSPAMASSSLGMARLNGSNRAAWNAMDLQIGPRPLTPTDRSHAVPEAVGDNGAVSARNILIRQKLRERKRYDSADDAMKKAAARAAARHRDVQPQQQPPPPPPPPTQVERPFSPAQMGQAAFFNAMVDSDETMEPTASEIKRTGRQVQCNVPTVRLEPSGSAEQGRNALIQHKLQNRAVFDSADYQLARLRGGDGYVQQSAGETDTADSDTDMEVPEDDSASTAVSSPNAAAVRHRQQFATMSPSVSRPGKYGALESRKKPNRRDLRQQLADKTLDAATSALGSQPASSTVNRGTDGNFAATAPGASKYGKLCAQHVLIRRKLKERKRFDSADYAMKLQGQAPAEAPGQDDVGVENAALSPVVGRYGALSASPASINHQVKHIKLSEEAHGRVATQPAGNAARYGTLQPATGTKQDSALVARNVLLQRKLSERKMFDSGDHFKAVAAKKDAAAARSVLLQRSLQGHKQFDGGNYAGLVKKATSSG